MTKVVFSEDFAKELVRRFPNPDAYQRACAQAMDQTKQMFEALEGTRSEAANYAITPEISALIHNLKSDAPTLIDWRAVGKGNINALALAAYAAVPQLVGLLIERGLYVNEKEHISARTERAVSSLVMAISATNTPTEHVKNRGRQCVQMLLEAGALVHVPHRSSQIPIHFARDAQVSHMLIAHGANPMERGRTRDSGTALHHAAEHADAQRAEILIDAGVELGAENDRQRSAAKIALDKEYYYKEERIDSAFADRRFEAGEKERACAQIRRMIATRQNDAEILFEEFMEQPDFAVLPDHALIYFSNIGKLDKALDASVVCGQEQAVLELLLQLPPWLQQDHAPIILAINSKLHRSNPASWSDRLVSQREDMTKEVTR